MCLFPSAPKAPGAPPAPPPLPQKTATQAESPLVIGEARKLASRLGTNSLVIPFNNVNVPNQ